MINKSVKHLEDLRVIIVGGGLVGMTAAIAFKRLGARVTLIEQAPEIRAAGASINLWKNALDVFDDLGLGEQIRATGVPLETWFYDAAGKRYRAPGYDPEDYAFTLFSRPVLTNILADAVGRENIMLNSKLAHFDEDADRVTITLTHGKQLQADLLIGADGVYSTVRRQLLPSYPAKEHKGHHVWRAVVAPGDEAVQNTILTVGHNRTRGGLARTAGNQVFWMINQFNSEQPTGTKKEQALRRAANLNDAGWGDSLIRLIEATPEDSIIFSQIMYVPELPFWVSKRVALVGDAAHGLSPHIAAGGALGIEDIQVLTDSLIAERDISAALKRYEAYRMPYFDIVRRFSNDVEQSADSKDYAGRYAAFTHWMLNDGYKAARSFNGLSPLVASKA
ncbi:FAD-dependent monooxygenase [Dyadobacter chenwenxiniae]|uniref:FAD-dependent monooxygenase n=1 Tax=Dyadobacter chenwenxiniae TaxID=2906456 RepID=A0A9X1PFK0_9BACT|nr:FAD-dependent monooxygenase [Dyadobacter chenwenxiniae]MCF0060412.1 FAD-dependent monooxygenase [Dyadobacter chenwenxiniae]UON86143.1 FAD-dependent monooxygenase [Dyadobacter chenwenxiniae]